MTCPYRTAAKFCRSPRTSSAHEESAFRKPGVRSDAEPFASRQAHRRRPRRANSTLQQRFRHAAARDLLIFIERDAHRRRTLNARSGECRYHERVLHAAGRSCRLVMHTRGGGECGRHASDEARGTHRSAVIPRRFAPGINNNRTGVQYA
ncbi:MULTISPECIES: hypothetical protein [Burkholderia]|uniref:hypothetical protein n=1 Tax=Burkholderia TaxID=32008 RepID=UPI0009C0F5F1|nr:MULTISPECIES: hypothetical protein [Burkholderia]MDN7820505.1 hypothetical protein [Burkholderia vietnamiensis]QMI48306.1 hypothetical protein MBR110_23190 [Burkholderia sp. MBR-1]